MNRLHKLAVFISHIYGDYQSALCKEVIAKAESYGYFIDFFVSNDETIVGAYGVGEQGIFHIPNMESYQGMLILPGTYLVPEVKEKLLKMLEGATCPIVDINNPDSMYPTILLDNNTMLYSLVAHLHTVHNLSHLCFLGCSTHPDISILREEAFIAAMKHYDLDYGTDTRYDCEENYVSMCEALNYLLDITKEKKEAIVCYNDNIALMVIEELARRGLRVPEDIAVTGCDNLEYGDTITPPLTTISFPAKELGAQAFDTLLALMDHQYVEQRGEVKAVPIYKGSCGCSYIKKSAPIIASNHLNDKVKHLEGKILENIFMRGNLQSYESLDEVMGYVSESITMQKEIADFYLFLYSDWHEIDHNLSQLLPEDNTFREKNISLKLGISRGKQLPDYTFTNKEAVEKFLDEQTDPVRLFVPLYFEKKEFGFICFTYQKNQIYYPFTFVNWLQSINMVLKNLSDQRSMRLIKEHLQDLNYKDDLTGLCNRQGFQYYALELLGKYKETKTAPSLLVLEIDEFQELDSLIGLAESDFALQIFSKAIQKIVNSSYICSRYRGANFHIMGAFDTEKAVYDMLMSIQTYLKNYQELYNKEYLLKFSYSYIPLEGYTEDDLYDSLFHSHEGRRRFEL